MRDESGSSVITGPSAAAELPAAWLRGFAERCGARNALQLFRYRATTADFLALREVLRCWLTFDMEADQLDPHMAGCFCLYAAEWWRREYAGGAWSWGGVLRSLGRDPDEPRARIYLVAQRGLAYWRRPILKNSRRRTFLVTLAYEGGLPLKLLHQEGRHFQRYFRALLEQMQAFGPHGMTAAESAAQVARHLPPSFQRDEVYLLAGEIAEIVWRLQAQAGAAPDPVAALDRDRPGWEQDLPVALDDATAAALIRGLVREAREVSLAHERQFTVTTTLSGGAGAWRVTRSLQAPGAIRNPEQLRQALGAQELPPRFQVYLLEPTGGLRLLTVATAREGGYLLEPVYEGTVERSGAAALLGFELSFVHQGRRLGLLTAKGGEALSELPWVFTPPEVATRALTWIGEGSVRTPLPEVLVAIPAGTRLTVVRGDVTSEGAVDLGGQQRSLLRLRGEARWEGEDEACRLACSESALRSGSYRLRGQSLDLDHSGQPIYLGLPDIIYSEGQGPEHVVAPTELEWRLPGGGARWRPVAAAPAPLGELLLRHSRGGEVLMRWHLRVLPRQTEIRLLALASPTRHTHAGRILLRVPEGATIAADIHPNVACVPSQEGAAQVLTFQAQGPVPSQIGVSVRWPQGRQLRLLLPFPCAGIRFVGHGGAALNDSAVIHLDRLASTRVEVLTLPNQALPQLWGRLLARNLPEDAQKPQRLCGELSAVQPSRYALDLGLLRDQVQSLLSMTRALDAIYELWIDSPGAPPGPLRKLRIALFEGEIDELPANSDGLRSFALQERLPKERLDQISLQALSITRPSQRRPLPRGADDTFSLDPAALSGMAPGPWLILGSEGSWCRMRPKLINSPNPPPPELPPDSLDALSLIPEALERHKQLHLWAQQLAVQPEDAQWLQVDEALDTLDSLPPTTLNHLNALLETPAALAMLVLRVPRARLDVLWRGAQRLPFTWSTMAAAHWMAASQRWTDGRRRRLQDIAPIMGFSAADIDARVLDSLSPLLHELPQRLPGLGVIAELVRHRVLQEPLQPGQLLHAAQQHRGDLLLLGELRQARQQLLQAHATDWWPDGPSTKELMSSLVSLPPALHKYLEQSVSEQTPEWHCPVLLAPLVAAVACARKQTLSKAKIFGLRSAELFDTHYYREAHRIALTLIVAHMLTHDPRQLG